jgi:hypothetical protein
MAKVTAPFFSLTAGGTIGDAITYSRWKGVKYVRQYVKPSDPNSQAQQDQRGFLRSAVDAWHETEWAPEDKITWDRWALYSSPALSGFNKFVSEYMNVARAGKAWHDLFNLHVEDASPGHFNICAERDTEAVDMDVMLHIGTDQGFLPEAGNLTWVGGSSQYESGDQEFNSGTILYIQLWCEGANWGGKFGNFRYQVT